MVQTVGWATVVDARFKLIGATFDGQNMPLVIVHWSIIFTQHRQTQHLQLKETEMIISVPQKSDNDRRNRRIKFNTNKIEMS